MFEDYIDRQERKKKKTDYSLAFGGLLTPPGMLSGMDVVKKV